MIGVPFFCFLFTNKCSVRVALIIVSRRAFKVFWSGNMAASFTDVLCVVCFVFDGDALSCKAVGHSGGACEY